MVMIKRRGMRPLRVGRGDASHDPIAIGKVGKAVWIGDYDRIPEPVAAPLPPAAHKTLLPELPPPPEQHNAHVMAYWQWRCDRLVERIGGAHGR
jgi:hypothetical protein